MSKSFCTNCESIQQYTPHCIQCQSKNIFNVGPDARFPKHPKKDDYFHFFGILLNRMERCSELHNVIPIHKWITNHKYRNHISPHNKQGLSYNERAELLLIRAQRRELKGQIKKDVRHVSGGQMLMNDNIRKIISKYESENGRGYSVHALHIISGGDSYDEESELNPFRPKSVNDPRQVAFKDKNVALAVSATLAQLFLASRISNDHDKLKEWAETFAKKKRDLLQEFPEYFV